MLHETKIYNLTEFTVRNSIECFALLKRSLKNINQNQHLVFNIRVEREGEGVDLRVVELNTGEKKGVK